MYLLSLLLLASTPFAGTVENVTGKVTPGVHEAAVYAAAAPLEVGTFERKGVTWRIRCKKGSRPSSASCAVLGGSETASVTRMSVQNGGSDMPDGGLSTSLTVEMAGCHVIVRLNGLGIVGDVADAAKGTDE